MSFRTILILINAALIVAFLAFVALRVLRLKNNTENTPENLTPFFDDDVLASRAAGGKNGSRFCPECMQHA